MAYLEECARMKGTFYDKVIVPEEARGGPPSWCPVNASGTEDATQVTLPHRDAHPAPQAQGLHRWFILLDRSAGASLGTSAVG